MSGPLEIEGFHAIVPAGGAGTRLWPLSRAGRPKFLLDLTGTGRTLLQATWDRLLPLTGADRIVVVTGAAHVDAVSEQLKGLPEANLVAEPSPRDSAAAIGLAVALIARRDPSAVVGSFAADHVIRNEVAFQSAVAEAVAVARTGDVVTLGIDPTVASTSFGYIRRGELLGVEGAPSARRVSSFVEKPDVATAIGYLASGEYLWNAGMFVARADTLLELLQEYRPALHHGVTRIAAAWDTPQRDEVLGESWRLLEKVAIDYALAEPAAAAGRVAVVPADLDWDDVGDFASLGALLGDQGTVRVLGDPSQVFGWDCDGVVVTSGDRVVAILGLDDVVIVDTPDVLLVTTRERAQDVKGIVEHLRGSGSHRLT